MTVVVTVAGIVVPSLLAVAALRRWIVDVPWRIAALFIVLTVAFLGGAVFTSRLPVPVDEVARGYPYRGVFGEIQPRNPLTNDTVKLFLPWMQVAREELSHGRAPLWNRYSFSGYPLLANGESAPFAPTFLATLFVPLPKQIVAMAGLKIFLSLLFGYLFIRREGVPEAAAAFGAAAFAFSVFETVFLYYSTTAVTSLAPAALFALLYSMDVAAKRGVVLVAIIVGALMASGHPESVLHIALAAAAVLAIDAALSENRREWISRFKFPVLGALSGLIISAPSWVPVAEQVLESTRFAEVQTAAYEPPFPWTAAWALVAPNGFGNPVRHNWSWIRNYSTVATSYIGLLVLACFLAAMVSRRLGLRYRLWGAAAIVAMLIAMQWTIIGKTAGTLPLLSVSANDKLRFVTCLLAAAVAAKWLGGAPRPAMFVATGVPLALLAVRAWSQKRELGTWADLAGAAAVMTFLVVLTLPRLRPHAGVAAFALCAAELFALNVPFNALVDAKYFRPRLPIIEAIRSHAAAEPFRVAGYDWAFLPNASAQYQLEDVRGSDPMSYRRYTEFLRLIAAQAPGTDVLRILNIDHPAIDFLNVRYLIADPAAGFGGRWKEIYRGGDGVLYENSRVLPRFYAPRKVVARGLVTAAEAGAVGDFSQEAIISGEEPAVRENPAGAAVVVTRSSDPHRFELEIDAVAPVLVVSSQPMSRWWSVRVNGRPARTFTVNSAFLGFSAGAGRSRVVIEYVPWSYYASVLLALAGTGALLLIRGRRTLPKVVE